METRTAQTIVKFYSVLTYIGSALLLIVGISLIFGGSLLGFMMDAATAQMMDFPSTFMGNIAGAAAIAIGVVVLLLAVLFFRIAQGLWRHEPWSRVAVIVIGVVELFSFPLGTLLGGFAVWFFGISAEGKGLFMQSARKEPVTTPAKAAKKSARKKK